MAGTQAKRSSLEYATGRVGSRTAAKTRARVRRHLFECEYCLHRLLDMDVPPAPMHRHETRPRAAAGRAYVY